MKFLFLSNLKIYISDVITAYKMKIAKLEPDIEKIEREADEVTDLN